MPDSKQVGKVGWIGISVEDATGLRDFYTNVVGWKSGNVNMGDCSDYSMLMPGTGDAVSGICFARGSSAGLPGGWLIDIDVEDIEQSAAACIGTGGRIIAEPRAPAGGRFSVVEDPGGATAADFQM